jgi:hypothetical protein
MGVLLKLTRWLFQKTATAGLIVGLGVAACGLWLFLRDNVDFDEWRHDVLRTLTGERAKIQSALTDVHLRLSRISADITTAQERMKQADGVIAQLKGLDSTWDRFTGDTQQAANSERRVKMEKMRADAAAQVATLQTELTRTTWERDGLEIALGKLDTQLRAAEAKRSKVLHYLSLAWNYRVGKLRVKWWVALVLGLYFLGPTAGKVAMYYGVAPIIVRGKPVRLAAELDALPLIGHSSVSTEITLKPGEQLWVRERFLQASDEGLARRTRFVLDWRIPFTCVAAGLIELVEMRNGRPLGDLICTLSNQSDPHSELAVVTLPAESAMVIRPSFLAGVIRRQGEPLVIRRRWQLFRWQAWVTLQFRFFEFVGPCRLVIAGKRGVRAEWLANRTGNPDPARRANQDATIGFSSNLDYEPVRAETFWGYYRGMNPLFDDLFSGPGVFLCQEVSSEGSASAARRFWSRVWGGAMKVFGL